MGREYDPIYTHGAKKFVLDKGHSLYFHVQYSIKNFHTLITDIKFDKLLLKPLLVLHNSFERFILQFNYLDTINSIRIGMLVPGKCPEIMFRNRSLHILYQEKSICSNAR